MHVQRVTEERNNNYKIIVTRRGYHFRILQFMFSIYKKNLETIKKNLRKYDKYLGAVAVSNNIG